MSKFLKIMIVLLTIVAVATPVMAEDRLSLAGQMRVRGWHMDDGTSDQTESYMDQRLRLGGKLSVAEGVSVTFRTDITESDWGTGNTFGSGRTSVDGSNFQSMHFDRAHLDLVSGNLHFRAGQQYLAFGKNGFDTQSNGLTLNVKGAVPLTFFWLLEDDNDTPEVEAGFEVNQTTGAIDPVAAEAANTKADGQYYGARVAHKGDSYEAQVFLAGQIDISNAGEHVNVLGLTYGMDIASVNLYGELEFFTGDATATADAVGTQLIVIADLAASEMLTVGGKLFYSMGDDTDVVYTKLGADFGGWDPMFEMGTGLDNEDIGAGRPFEFWQQAGVVALQLNGSLKATDDLTVAAVVGMAQTEDDKIIDDDATFFGAGVSYAVMANTKLGAQVEYIDRDLDADADLQAGVGLFVNF